MTDKMSDEEVSEKLDEAIGLLDQINQKLDCSYINHFVYAEEHDIPVNIMTGELRKVESLEEVRELARTSAMELRQAFGDGQVGSTYSRPIIDMDIAIKVLRSNDKEAIQILFPNLKIV